MLKQPPPSPPHPRHFDFCDLAPLGYLSVSEQGLILHANLATATLLNVARHSLDNQVFSRFIDTPDQATFTLLCQQLLEGGTARSCELQMVRLDGSRFSARLDAVATIADGGAPLLRMVLSDITGQKQAKEELRIAAAAFQVQEAIVVMGHLRQIVRVNRAFTQLTGYSEQDVLGEVTTLLRSKQQPEAGYENIWRHTLTQGTWLGDCWLQRKNGQDFFARLTTAAIKNERDQVTHYVLTFSDQTVAFHQEEQRVKQATLQREALVRELHHRIKNSLQGIRGLLQQVGNQKPEIAAQIQLVLGHLQGISVIHGLQGRRDEPLIRLCELTREIAQAASTLWQTPILVDVPANWFPRIVTEKEAVPLALVLNELMVNALKHGGQAKGQVSITLRQGQSVDEVELTILNAGVLPDNKTQPTEHQHGLQLVDALRPDAGFKVTLSQHDDQVHTVVTLSTPVVALHTQD